MNFDRIRANYINGFWNAAMVQMAVKKSVITQSQADAIIAETNPEQVLINEITQEVSEIDY